MQYVKEEERNGSRVDDAGNEVCRTAKVFHSYFACVQTLM